MGKHAAPRRRAAEVTPAEAHVAAYIEWVSNDAAAPEAAPAQAPAPRTPAGGRRRAVKPSRVKAPVSRTVVRATAVMGGLAAAATGVVVVSGVAGGGEGVVNAAAAISQPTVDRQPELSRSSDRRTSADPAKAASLAAAAATDVQAVTKTVDAADGDPKAIASALLSDYGWSGSQFDCLDRLWTRESNWRVNADNPHSSAYGIPQALPGSKMASAGPDWQHNPVTQIKWGLGYIKARYGTPCGAWGHSEARGFY